MRRVQEYTLTELFDGLAHQLIYASEKKLDYHTSIDCHLYDVLASADSMEWEYDLKTQWLTKGRWSTLIRQYLDPDDTLAWIDLCSELRPEKDRGVATLRTKTVKPRDHGGRKSRRFGSCLISFSYRAIPQPQITMHSRASYLGYLGPLDLNVAYNMARYVGERHDLKPEDFKFMWYCEALQWPNYKSLGYMLSDPELKPLLTKPDHRLTEAQQTTIDRYPAIRHSRKWMRRFLKQDERDLTYGEAEKYGAVRRIRQRYHAEFCEEGYGDRFTDGDAKALKPLPSLDLATLTLAPIGLEIK